MKRAIGLLAALLLLSSDGAARDITTLTNQTFRNITVTRVDPTGVVVSHRDGVHFLEFAILPAAIRKEFGYEEAQAALAIAAKKRQEQALVDAQRRVATTEAAARQAQELQRQAEMHAAAARVAAAQMPVPAPALVIPGETDGIASRSYSDSSIASRSYDSPTRYSGGSSGGSVRVSGYYRKNGTYVRSYTRRK